MTLNRNPMNGEISLTIMSVMEDVATDVSFLLDSNSLDALVPNRV